MGLMTVCTYTGSAENEICAALLLPYARHSAVLGGLTRLNTANPVRFGGKSAMLSAPAHTQPRPSVAVWPTGAVLAAAQELFVFSQNQSVSLELSS